MHPASTSSVNSSFPDQRHYSKKIYAFVDRPCCPECHEVLKPLSEIDQERNQHRNEQKTRRCHRCRRNIVPMMIKIIEPLNLQAITDEYREN